jgi:hypothetical protein
MLRLEALELVKQPVEVLVGDLRRIVNVVPLLVMADLLAELVDAIEWLHWRTAQLPTPNDQLPKLKNFQTAKGPTAKPLFFGCWEFNRLAVGRWPLAVGN